MPNYANNPQAISNGFYSASRNIFLMSAVAVAMYGFSNTFKITRSDSTIKIVSIVIFSIALAYGINTCYAYQKYIDLIKQDKENLPNYVDFRVMENYVIITSAYLVLLVIIVTLMLIRLFNRLSGKK